MKLSVIIPVFNTGKYLEKAVNSIINQNINLEVIIINDGSTDDSQKYINLLAQKHPNITSIKTKNFGVSHARNIGLKLAKGDYVTFIDADDYLDEMSYEILFKNGKYDIYLFSYDIVAENNIQHCIFDFIEDESILDPEDISLKVLPRMLAIKNSKEKMIMGSVCRLIIKKDILEDIWFDENLFYAEDLVFCFRVLLKAKNCYITNKCFYKYIRYSNTSTEKFKKDLFSNFLNVYNQINNLISLDCHKSRNLIQRLQAFKMKLYSLSISNCFRFDADKTSSKKELKKIYHSFQLDNDLKNILSNNFIDKMRKINWVLLKLHLYFLVEFIYSQKEKSRQRRLKI